MNLFFLLFRCFLGCFWNPIVGNLFNLMPVIGYNWFLIYFNVNLV